MTDSESSDSEGEKSAPSNVRSFVKSNPQPPPLNPLDGCDSNHEPFPKMGAEVPIGDAELVHSRPEESPLALPILENDQDGPLHENGCPPAPVDTVDSSQDPDAKGLKIVSIEAFEDLSRENVKLKNELERIKSHLLVSQRENDLIVEEMKNQVEKEKLHVLEKSFAMNALQEENKKLKEKLASDFEIEELANLKKTIQFMEDEHKEDVQMKTYLLTKEVDRLKGELTRSRSNESLVGELLEKIKKLEDDNNRFTNENAMQALELIRLSEDYEPLKHSFDSTLQKLNSYLQDNQNVVDKRVVKTLFIRYITDHNQRTAILEVVGRLLTFTDEERKAVGLIGEVTTMTSWLPEWWRRAKYIPDVITSIVPKRSEPKTEVVLVNNVPDREKSFADLWVEFLLSEAREDIDRAPPCNTTNSVNTNEPLGLLTAPEVEADRTGILDSQFQNSQSQNFFVERADTPKKTGK